MIFHIIIYLYTYLSLDVYIIYTYLSLDVYIIYTYLSHLDAYIITIYICL